MQDIDADTNIGDKQPDISLRYDLTLMFSMAEGVCQSTASWFTQLTIRNAIIDQ